MCVPILGLCLMTRSAVSSIVTTRRSLSKGEIIYNNLLLPADTGEIHINYDTQEGEREGGREGELFIYA